jgi:hypothetical protein
MGGGGGGGAKFVKLRNFQNIKDCSVLHSVIFFSCTNVEGGLGAGICGLQRINKVM